MQRKTILCVISVLMTTIIGMAANEYSMRDLDIPSGIVYTKSTILGR